MEIKPWQELNLAQDATPIAFNLLKAQVIKDCQLDLIPDEIHDLQELRNALHGAIDYWISRNPERLAQTLYRVDLNTSQAQSVFQEFEANQEVESWAEAILRRCLQKCLFRLWYAQKNRSGNQDTITE